MNLENKEFTFWKLISNYTIEIPAIQRDYVQDKLYSGLQKEECDIVGDIANSLTNKTKISLHFVYGKVDNQDLIPLDGQQRLTTLFLIHWFLSLGILTDDNKKILSKFTYETRPSSEDFCLKLVKESIEFKSNIVLSQQIINSKWFFLSWKSDPTIKAMLNMLDIIQKKFKQPNEELFDLMRREDCPVIFSFLPLDQFKLDDEIYVKMNSRGKPLTDFENFKANFSVLFNIDNKSKLDNEWLDIFWKFEKDKQNIRLDEVDRKYLTFIENISLCFLSEYKDINRAERDNFSIFKCYKDIYSSIYLNQITKIFDSLTTYYDTRNYFVKFLTPNPDYWEYLRFYAVAQFFIHCGELNDTKKEAYNNWMRICTNLINNTRIEDPESFYKAVRSIKELATATHITNIYEYLSLPETKIAGFLQNQCEEEKLKAKLIFEDKSDQWFAAIEKIELHSYFNGQIGFILEFAKTDNGYDLNIFTDYSEKLNKLFSSEFQDKYNCLFQRALLVFGDYLVYISGHYTFCKFEYNLRAKTDNWRKVFNDTTKNIYLKQLLDNIKIESIKNDLQSIIDKFQDNENDWMSLFIKNKDIIEYCCDKQSGVKNYQIDKIGSQIYLARSNANRWKRKAELRSYVFYKTKLEGKESSLNPFERIWYFDSSDSIPCAVIDNWNYRNIYSFALDIRYSNNNFILKFYDMDLKTLPDEITQKLNQIKFISKIEKNDEDIEVIKYCICKIEGFKAVESKINEILNM